MKLSVLTAQINAINELAEEIQNTITYNGEHVVVEVIIDDLKGRWSFEVNNRDDSDVWYYWSRHFETPEALRFALEAFLTGARMALNLNDGREMCVS